MKSLLHSEGKMKFDKIVSVDYTGIDEFVHNELKELCNNLIIYNDFPKSQEEIINRCKDADAILVSWNTPITDLIIKSLPKLKYIGMCCSLYDEASSNVNIKQAKEQGILVKGVMHYGDNGVVEFIFSELIRLFKGIGEVQYRDEQIELEDINLGIIGYGTVGKMVADTGKFFSMNISYYNRTKKDNIIYEYKPLEKLLRESDVISTHLPRHTVVLNKKEFKQLGNGKVLINTGLTPSFELDAFDQWINNKGNFAIFDSVSVTKEFKTKYQSYKNVIMCDKVTGFTKNARRRLAYKVIENIKTI